MDITYEQTFNGYPINTDREKGMGCYTKGLAILQDKLESMMENHSKVLVTRVDLRYPQDGSVEPSSNDFTLFNKNLTRDLERNNILPETGRLRGKKRNDSNKTPKHQVDPSVTIVCEKHGEDKILMRTLSSWSTGTPREILVMFRKELPGLGKQHSVWRTVQAWYTIVKSLIFWTVHLRNFNKRSTTPFTITATRSKYEVRNIVVRGRGWFAEHGGAKGARRKVAHPN